MEFSIFGKAVAQQLDLMQSQSEMFTADADKYEMWDTYLGSFPEGANPIYLTNTEHDCNCCKQFIRGVGNAVTWIDGELVSVWDIDIGGDYQIVADAMSAFVKSKGIRNIFRRSERKYGSEVTTQYLMDLEAVSTVDGDPVTRIDWNHFYAHLNAKYVITDGTLGGTLGMADNNYKVLKRSLTEITPEAIEIVTDLIASNAIHRGAEQKVKVDKLKEARTTYADASNKEQALWQLSANLGMESAFRNTVIGTLLCDLSEGVPLEIAVKKYEDKVSGTNYKRSTALFTEGMKVKAFETLQELGLEEAVYRRHAVASDITINNVIFADNSIRKDMGALDLLGTSGQKPKSQNLGKVEEMTIAEFIENIMPRVDSMEMMLDNKHIGNLLSLIAPTYLHAGNILAWDNNFSWTYNGEVADSMKSQVKDAGGNVEGELRFSIRWNENGNCQSDLDAHCKEPNGRIIYYSNTVSPTGGNLDVDVRTPGSKVAVENITWPKAHQGRHEFMVHNFSNKGGNEGFTAEVEFKGQITQFVYNKPIKQHQTILVADVSISGDKISFSARGMDSTKITRETWGVETQSFHKVKMVMQSPNYWDEQAVGNQQYFFILEGCNNPDPARGFYTEFLRKELYDTRKVFEMLGSKLKAEHSDDQLSGLGFSVTKRDDVLVKVRGSFNRTIKITF